MEWQQLEYFRVVARLEHFGQAAKELAMGVQEIQHLKNPYTGTVS
ncbi:LysR family transcriptional regulator [Brevibacillus nitrificans]|nr:LysR family transcriptional regulator [Brevibacillus nitrificans]MDR7318338.1 DNA-binding transcriptional LysR family regulator [Brevibacillus nitrificans]